MFAGSVHRLQVADSGVFSAFNFEKQYLHLSINTSYFLDLVNETRNF